jgi:NADH dehydrogenase (ubiquinone) 1 alpha subcomplex subunit 9
MNFDDPKMIDRVIRNSNVVINMVGPRKQIRKLHDFEYANIDIPKRIAEACSRNPGVLRLIHFSAAGTAADSPSLDLQTRIHGEEEVRYHYPGATILRPTTIYGLNDYFIANWYTRLEYFYNFIPVFDDCSARRQPIYAADVALAVLNALKMPESAGKTYELGRA